MKVFWSIVLVGLTAGVVPALAQDVSPRAFRLFLVDGTEVATHGEPSRVGDAVVALVPVGVASEAVGAGPALQIVTLSADQVDWPRTEAYLETVRLAQYTAARGEREYAAFTAEIAAALDQVSSMPDPLAKIARVEAVRRQLATWPSDHYGFRRVEATAMLSMLDEVLLGLRAAAGQREFSLALTSAVTPAAPPAPALRSAPTLQDVVTQALGLAPFVANPSEREALLTHALAGVMAGDSSWDQQWRRRTRRTIERRLDEERRATRAYAALRTRILARAARLAASADVRALMSLRADTTRRDERLGHRRPSEVTALLAHLDGQLTEARQRRLLLDRWEARRPILDAFERGIAGIIVSADPVFKALDDIRTLSGPPLADLERASAILKGVEAATAQVQVPGEGRELHGLLLSGVQMAATAVARRRAATQSGNLGQAWEASAAAAGALLVFDRLRADLARLSQPPSATAVVASVAR